MTIRIAPVPLTPVSFLVRSARLFAGRTAIVHGDKRITYAGFGERVGRAAAVLRGLGVGAGDRVAYLCPNVPAMLDAPFAVPMLNAVLVTINTRLAPAEVAYILDHSGARVLVIDSELAPNLAPLLGERKQLEHVIAVRDTAAPDPLGAPEYEELLAATPPLPLAASCDDEERVLAINYTSGTTGFPKGVMYTHRGAYLNALSVALHFDLRGDSSYLWLLPLFHCNGWCFPWALAAVGAKNVCTRKVDPVTAADLIVREDVSNFCGAPTVLITLSNDPTFRAMKAPRRLKVGTGGAPPAPQVIRTMEALGAELVHVYGLTETYGPYTLCEWMPEWSGRSEEERARLKARQGVAHVAAGELRVVDKEMKDVPADGETMGEIVMRGNLVMAGYYNNPQATEEAFRGGWFHSGDLGVMHADGYIELRDRGKDIIISGGENISTVEVERTLYEHPAVLEVAVIGIPDDKWGEVPKAFVTLRDGASATPEELIEFCRARIAKFKCPKAVAFEALPKTSTGKIQKYLLREREWKGRERRIN